MNLNEQILEKCLSILKELKTNLHFHPNEVNWKPIIQSIEQVQELNGGDFKFKMRPTQRIAPVLNRLKASWTSVPDLRLGQLLINAATHYNKDLFYLEDEDLLKLVETFIKEVNQ